MLSLEAPEEKVGLVGAPDLGGLAGLEVKAAVVVARVVVVTQEDRAPQAHQVNKEGRVPTGNRESERLRAQTPVGHSSSSAGHAPKSDRKEVVRAVGVEPIVSEPWRTHLLDATDGIHFPPKRRPSRLSSPSLY